MSCRTYLATILPASESAAGCARLVLTNAMRAAAGMSASVGRLPPAHRQYSQDGCTAGGGIKVSPRAAVGGSIGGAAGGGGIVCPDCLPAVVPDCPLAVSLLLVIKVSVCSVMFDAGTYSQHGSTL